MELLENTGVHINEYCEQLVVTYLAEDAPLLEKLFESLDAKGYAYVKNELSYYTVVKNSYTTWITSVLRNCGCYVLVISDKLFPKNKTFGGINGKKNLSLKHSTIRNHLWYQIGYLESRDKAKTVLPLRFPGSVGEVTKTPIGECQWGFYDLESTLKKIETKIPQAKTKTNFFMSEIAKEEETKLNGYISDRLRYRKLVLKLDITKEDYEAAKDLFAKELGKGGNIDKDFEKALKNHVSLSCKLLSFGSKKFIIPQLEPYASEMIIKPTNYPSNFSCRKQYCKKDEKSITDGILAEYRFELIVPVHCLFGVNFKPCIKGSEKISGQVLNTLFGSGLKPENDAVVHEEEQALYFSLAFPKAREYTIDPSLGIGTKGDYLFPQ